MITPVRTSKRAESGQRRHRRRLATAVVAAVATLTGPLVIASAPADATPVDDGWSLSSPGGVTNVTSDGADSAAEFTYDFQNAGFGDRAWEFTAQAANAATPGDPIKVPYTWQGLHAWFDVTAQLQAIVNGNPVATPETQVSPVDGLPYLVNAGPQNCCTTPSNGFLYRQRRHVHHLQPGDVYGFRLIGRNGDFNNFLQRHLHPQHQALHRRDHRLRQPAVDRGRRS